MRIDYYFTVLSPFAYLAGERLERIAARHGADIAYRPIKMGPLFAELGYRSVADRPVARQAYRLQELRRLSRWAGMPLNEAPAHFPTDQTHASAAVMAIGEAGGDPGPFARAAMRAVWAEERDVGEEAVVDALLAGTGHDPDALRPARAGAAAALEDRTREAIGRGVFGSPFYFVGEEMFWGQDRLDALDRWLGEAAK